MMNRQGTALFEAPIAHDLVQHFEWEEDATATGAFIPVAVERPGGGRIRDKRDPDPADIIYVQGVSRRIPLHRLAAVAWQALVNEARAAGIQSPLLLPVSGYRSWAEQNILWQRALRIHGSPGEARKYVAPPGGSAHQSGRAIDLFLGGSIAAATSSKNISYLRTRAAYQWLVANAQRFGFYPYPVEPWHWEYNPPASTVRPQPQPRQQPPNIRPPTLFLGSRGSAVRDLQTRLNRWMARPTLITTRLLIVDGIFGPLTQGVVCAFQRWAGLKTDGIVGPLTWGRLLRLNPAPGPQPQPPPSTTPKLIGSENQPPGTTLYVDIRLGEEGLARPMTGIFIPKDYRPQPKVDILLYLHGFKTPKKPNPPQRKDPGWSIDWYWRQPMRAFREGVNESGKNVILVAPTLGQFSKPGTLTAPGGFDRYIDQVMATLATHGPYRGRRPVVGNIILAAHSGGGSPMISIALANQRYTSLIRECWAFDSMYGGSQAWADWAVKNPQARLYNYYRQTRGKNGRPNGTWPTSEDLQRKNLPNVSTTPVPCGYSQGRESCKYSHDQIPIQYWLTRTKGAPFLTDR